MDGIVLVAMDQYVELKLLGSGSCSMTVDSITADMREMRLGPTKDVFSVYYKPHFCLLTEPFFTPVNKEKPIAVPRLTSPLHIFTVCPC